MIISRVNNDDIGATLITRFLLVKVVGGVKEFIEEDFTRCSSVIIDFSQNKNVRRSISGRL